MTEVRGVAPAPRPRERSAARRRSLRSHTGGLVGRVSLAPWGRRPGALAAVAGVVLLAALGSPCAAAGGGAVCRLQPRVLDAARVAGPLVVRIELPDGRALLDPGVFVSSVGGTPLPGPGIDAEGIDEDLASRGEEKREEPRPGAAIPNGARVHVVRFDRPCDGDAATRDDGDAGDVLAMLLDLPDGAAAEVCISGAADGEPFTCCDQVVVRNRGLRDLPGGFPLEGGNR